jgi:hypothetical protein
VNVTELATDRIINGLVKGHEGTRSPQEIAARLARTVVVRCASGRCAVDDLWPAVWALASVLERQITGTIHIDTGIRAALPAPVSLGPKCVFGPCADSTALSIELGSRRDAIAIAGDARRYVVSLDPLATGEKPSPIECFLLAGYLGFQVLAALAEIPADRADFAKRSLKVEYDYQVLEAKLRQPAGFTFIGMGQVGQAFLALLWFLLKGDFGGRPLAIIDDDRFIDKNGRTQILLVQGEGWLNEEKAMYVCGLAERWNASAKPLPGRIDFSWRRESNPALAFLGTHDFESRRMACIAGFDEIIECGVGTDMMAPRISWTSAKGNTKAAKALFKDRSSAPLAPIAGAAWIDELKSQPGECGWVQFQGVSATAPCLGITAAAYALAESACVGALRQGFARVWPQLLEPLRSSGERACI